MDQLNYYLNKDYFKIKTNAGPEKVRKINIYLLGICGVLLFVILFYIILCSSTYYSKLDDLDDYVNEFRKKNLSKFDDINFGVKIMPSFSSEENNILVMKHSNNVRNIYINLIIIYIDR
jgi:hypothetical protein